MAMPLLATKLYIPTPRAPVVVRPRLIEQLNDGLERRIILISAPPGFGKTTQVSEWIAGCGRPAAWLSLDGEDNDPARFLAYLIAALQTIAPHLGEGLLGVLSSPQPPSTESTLTLLINEITNSLPDPFLLVLDDYHLIDAARIDQAIIFLLEHLPPQMHLVIVTRQDPQLPLARLRARGQLTELRAADLRFSDREAADFLNRVMSLSLNKDDISSLENRTEGWIAGLQLAAISIKGQKDRAGFIESFTGSHHFVMDYLVEEVLKQQPEKIQTFLLRTSILNRMCASLCEAILDDSAISGQETLEYLERANLFIVPLDNDRRWYRYHHLFAELLRQRLLEGFGSPTVNPGVPINNLHIRASQWYEDTGLGVEAFQHAAAANDLDRVERLIQGTGIPLHMRGAVTSILDWLGSLPKAVLDSRPSLWWRYASLLLVTGQTNGVEEKLDSAETALQDIQPDDRTRDLIGRIATARSVLALTRYQMETVLVQSRRALEYLDPGNLSTRASASWARGEAFFLSGDRAAARQVLTESLSTSQACGDIFTTLLATGSLGNVQEAENQLGLAVEAYQRVLELSGDQPLSIAYDSYLGLARIFYEWNDLVAAEQHGRQGLQLAQQYDKLIDRFIVCEIFLARLKLAQGDAEEAMAILAQADRSAHQNNFVFRLPEIAAAQALTLLYQGNTASAEHLSQSFNLPIIQARVLLAQGNASAALAVLEPLYEQAEEKGWEDERLKILVVKATAYQIQGEKDKAIETISTALSLAEPGGFIRLFLDEGMPMAQLLSDAAAGGIMPDTIKKLLAAFESEKKKENSSGSSLSTYPSELAPLSQRELDVLRLIAQGLSNREISQKLFLALDTVKGHNRAIFEKLQVQNRTEAVARARQLGIL